MRDLDVDELEQISGAEKCKPCKYEKKALKDSKKAAKKAAKDSKKAAKKAAKDSKKGGGQYDHDYC